MTAFLFSCDYATCAVPEAYREIFRGSEDVVGSGEGWEPGSLNLSQGFAMKFRTPLVHGDVTRLLIDFQRNGDARWSRFSMQLPEATRVKVAERHEKPYRIMLHQRISEDLRRHSRVLHVMIHTDPETDGRITLETPPGAFLAETMTAAWRQRIAHDELDVRNFRNADHTDLAAELSAAYPATQYAQMRLKISQSFFLEGRPWRWEIVKKHLLDTLLVATEDAAALSARESPSTARD